jgi:tetratricopeptide (TPR) repeat protein
LITERRLPFCVTGILRPFIAIPLLAGFVSLSSALTPDKLRDYFEWGNYQALIDTLEPALASAPMAPDSNQSALCHCYLGVAYFAKGRIGDAQKYFSKALALDSAIQPDRNYISEEIASLFNSTRSDYFEKKKQSRINDSLMTLQKKALEDNVKIIELNQLHAKKLKKTVWLISLQATGMILAGISGYEYYATKKDYQNFKNAAQNGDKLTYDRLQGQIRKANGVIFGCSVTAGISEVAGLFLMFKK